MTSWRVPRDYDRRKVTDLWPDEERAWAVPSDVLGHLSASSLQLLLRCPRAWQERYVKGRRERPGQSLVVGTAVHETTGYALGVKIEKGENLPVADVVTYFDDVGFEAAIENHGGADEIAWDEGASPDDLRPVARRMIECYHGESGPAMRVEPVAIEERFEILRPDFPIPVIGYVDIRQTKGRPLVDLKTSAKAERKLKPDWVLQGRIYQLAHGADVDWHVITKAKTAQALTGLDEPGLMQEWSPFADAATEKFVADAIWFLNACWKKWGPDDPWPVLGMVRPMYSGTACDFCGFRSDCPAWVQA